MINNLIKSIKTRLIILKVSIVGTFQMEIAHPGNNWSNVLSTTGYALTALLFVEIIFSNVDEVVGYTKGEILFFNLITQLTFYICWSLIVVPLSKFIRSVNTGNLDLLLARPLPTLFFINFSSWNIFSTLRDGLPTIVIFCLLIPWGELDIHLIDALFGVIEFLLGMIIFLGYTTMLSLPTIWLGEGENLFNLGMTFLGDIGLELPLEGLEKGFGVFFWIFLPIFLVAGGTTSIVLGKLEPIPIIIATALFAVVFAVLRILTWRYAIRNYTSASS